MNNLQDPSNTQYLVPEGFSSFLSLVDPEYLSQVILGHNLSVWPSIQERRLRKTLRQGGERGVKCYLLKERHLQELQGEDNRRTYEGDVRHFCRLGESRGILGFKFHVC